MSISESLYGTEQPVGMITSLVVDFITQLRQNGLCPAQAGASMYIWWIGVPATVYILKSGIATDITVLYIRTQQQG